MTQILSLAFGTSSPHGLSGGATPSAAPGLAFADLVSTPPAGSALQAPPHTGVQAAPVALGGGTVPAPNGAWLRGAVGTRPALPQEARLLASAAQVPPAQVLPAQDVAKPLPLSASPAASKPLPTVAAPRTPGEVAVDPETSVTNEAAPGQSQALAASVPLPSPSEAAPTMAPLQAEGEPGTDAVPQSDKPEPAARTDQAAEVAPVARPAEPEAAPVARPAEPGAMERPDQPRETGEPDVDAQRAPDGGERDHAPARSARAAEPEESTPGAMVEPAAPALRQTAFAPLPQGIASPARPLAQQRAGSGADGVQHDAPPSPDAAASPVRTTPSAASGTGVAPDTDMLRPVAAAPSTNAAPGDFAQMVDTNGAETAPLVSESGPGAGEMASQARMDAVRSQAGPANAPPSLPDTVSARPGEIGRQMGVEIVRHGLDGRDSLTIRLDPVEMGEIQIRLQFDERGTMRAHVSAESPVALEMLRRDSGDLVRALSDAGVRTDAQSFQFDGRGQGRGEQQGQHGRPQTPPNPAFADAEDDTPSQPHKLRSSGQLDLFA